MNLPDTILLEIFSYLPLPQRWLVASICQTWNRVCHDPYLYRHLVFENIEYVALVKSLQKILDFSPRIQSIIIKGCYSTFVQNTIVPVQFSTSNSHHNTTTTTAAAAAAGSPSAVLLFSHITALQPLRRRDEYIKHDFDLHNQFSDVFYQLLQINGGLKLLDIQDCTLDLEMTELFCAIVCHGHALESLTYVNNHDKGIHSSGLLQAMVIACPQMRHFRGLHSGMNDAVLFTMARHWTSLQSLTLCSHKSSSSREYHLGHHAISYSRRPSIVTTLSTPSSAIDCISSHALWQMLTRCTRLETLELLDLACISNHGLDALNILRSLSLRQQQPAYDNSNHSRHCQEKKKYSPYTTINYSSRSDYSINNNKPSSSSSNNTSNLVPGSSIQHIIITKYMTIPLSKPGFESLLQIFPNLHHLKYETNFHTFNNLFEGMTHDMFDAECDTVQKWFDAKKKKLDYIACWNAHVTAEQRLMAGMASVSGQGHSYPS